MAIYSYLTPYTLNLTCPQHVKVQDIGGSFDGRLKRETVVRAKLANLADIECRMEVEREPQNIEYRTAEPQK